MNLNVRLGKYRSRLNEEAIDSAFDDDNLAPVMPAIDAVQQLAEEENRNKLIRERLSRHNQPDNAARLEIDNSEQKTVVCVDKFQGESSKQSIVTKQSQKHDKKVMESPKEKETKPVYERPVVERKNTREFSVSDVNDEDDNYSRLLRHNPLNSLINSNNQKRQDEYELIPKSVILDVYSNDPEVKRFLKQLTKIGNEYGYNEQNYKCYSCRRPIGMVFGQSKLCHFDGHHYCTECHLGEMSVIPARILCNWDFNKYPISKRNQHFLNLISNEPMFELKTISPLLYKVFPELREIEELRSQAFFVRSYCFTCVQDSISFELTKLVWPREHLIKQTDLYSLEDLIQIKGGALKQILKNVISFGRQHVLSCMLCCQRGFICELCKSSQIIYPFDTESVHRCNECQSIYHKTCFISKVGEDACPRCQRLKARRNDN